MAIFVFLAWAMELAEKCGIIHTEPQNSKGRAYHRANEASQWLRHQLVGANIEVVEPDRIVYQAAEGPQEILCRNEMLCKFKEDKVVLHQEYFPQVEAQKVFALGPGGRANFTMSGSRLTADIWAADDQKGPREEHHLRVSFQVAARSP